MVVNYRELGIDTVFGVELIKIVNINVIRPVKYYKKLLIFSHRF